MVRLQLLRTLRAEPYSWRQQVQEFRESFEKCSRSVQMSIRAGLKVGPRSWKLWDSRTSAPSEPKSIEQKLFAYCWNVVPTPTFKMSGATRHSSSAHGMLMRLLH